MRHRIDIGSSLLLVVMRLIVVYLLFMLCRIVFYIHNIDLIGSFSLHDLKGIFKGGFIYDSASLFYVNLLFIVMSLIPFYFREKDWWQRAIAWVYVTTNSLALLIAVMDIFYYPYKLSRIASDDIRYLGEDNIGTLFGSFISEFWWGALIYIAFVAILSIVGFRWLRYRCMIRFSNPVMFYVSQSVVFVLTVIFSIIAIRGFNISKASYPIAMNDVTMYVKPQYSSLTLSNPFCLIRTLGKSVDAPSLISSDNDKNPYNPVKESKGESIYSVDSPNIVVIVLESFGAAHIKSLSDDIEKDELGYTPFLDSLFNEGVLMTNAYQSTRRSIDAMPAIWTSIPSYKRNLLSYSQAATSYKGLPQILKEKADYNTLFLHGSVSTSMSFKAFGQSTGVDKFYFQEDYEELNGKNDFDGKWGIWDDKFLPYALQQLNKEKQPFFATIFTLSSHNPFKLPSDVEGRYEEGKLPIHRTIRYTDDALRTFFNEASKQDWFRNSLFIITADHSEGAVTEKWQGAPYNVRIPLFFYTPSGILKPDRNNNVASHVDIMPTLLEMLDIKTTYFSYGRNLFGQNINDNNTPFVVHYNSGVFNVVTDKYVFSFDDNSLISVYDYRVDPYKKDNLKDKIVITSDELTMMKSYIQNYYTQLINRNFTSSVQ